MIHRTDFSLISCLSADLRRARAIYYEDSSNVSAGRLWFGMFSPRFLPVLICRLAYFFYCSKLVFFAKCLSLLNFFFFGIEIAIRCPIGEGLLLPHTQGTVIGAYSIGSNATIFQGVTLGAKEVDFSYQKSSRPTVQDSVIIGAGAKILGGVTLGSGSRIGANAVVLQSIPPRVLAAGIPARVLKTLV
jgi:serine O-acetyltransferase